MSRLLRSALFAAVVLVPAVAFDASAQTASAYPARGIKLVVPTPAGGPSDTAARMVAQALKATLGQPVTVENKAGAGGAIAAQAVMAAPADGYTLLWAQGSMAGLPLVLKNAPYKNMNELAPVSNVLQFNFGLFVNNGVPAKDFAELVAYGRAHPDKLTYATGTLGEYMVATHVLRAAGVQAVRVPYKGGAQLMPDLISGQVQLNFGPIVSGLQHVKAGKLKMMAVVAARRIESLPDVPTIEELGMPMADVPSWNAVFAPTGTPRDVTERLSDAIATALKDPALRATLAQQGAEPVGSTPQQLAASVAAATEAWKLFVRNYAIAPE